MDGVNSRPNEEETAYPVALGDPVWVAVDRRAPRCSGTSWGSRVQPSGTWVGAAVHDVAQVVATASTDGNAALEAATVVKLTRVVLLAPLVALVALRRRRAAAAAPAGADEVGSARPPLVPLFVAGFLAAIVVRSSDVLSADTLGSIKDIEKILLTLALVGLGMGVRFDRLRKLGGRPLVLGMVAWVIVAGVALAGVGIINA